MPDDEIYEDESDAMRNAREAATRAATERDTAQSEAQSAKRELAFARALPGVDENSALFKMFSTSYSGDLTTEAVAASAREIGLLGEAPPAAPAPDAADVELQATREALRIGATPPTTEEETAAALAAMKDPGEAGLEAFNASIQAGTARDDAAAEYFNRQIDAASKGDDRAIYRKANPVPS